MEERKEAPTIVLRKAREAAEMSPNCAAETGEWFLGNEREVMLFTLEEPKG